MSNNSNLTQREQLVERFNYVNSKIKEIEENDDIVIYYTKEKYLPGCGIITDIETIEELLIFKRKINELNANDFSTEIGQLKLEDSEIPKSDPKILGFKVKHWNADIVTKLEQIRNSNLLVKFTEARDLFEKHLNDDDTYNLDMLKIDGSIFE